MAEWEGLDRPQGVAKSQRWKKPGSLNDCMEQISLPIQREFETNFYCAYIVTYKNILRRQYTIYTNVSDNLLCKRVS